MNQSDESKLYNSWSRTPGKPASSSSFTNSKTSNISSSTDSGVSQTPNWTTENDAKFNLFDSNPWNTTNSDFPKKLSLDENSTKGGNNSLTFGFTSPWPTNNDMNVSLNRNQTWRVPGNGSSEFSASESNNIDNYWSMPTQSIDAGGDHLYQRSNSIWSTSTQKHYSHDSDDLSNTSNLDGGNFSLTEPNCRSNSSINNPSILSPESEKSSDYPLFSAFNNTAVNEVSSVPICDYNSSDITCQDSGNSCRSQDKSSEHQTWAQAAGKGLQPPPQQKADDSKKRELDEQLFSIINRVEGWGSHNVDQSTPWIVDDADSLKNSDKLSGVASQRNRTNVESNVWTNEPPNGVGIWENHYENIGERTSRWKTANQKPKPTGGWEINAVPESSIGSQWSDRDDNSVWSCGTNERQKQNWNSLGPIGSVGKQDVGIPTPIGSGLRNNPSQIYPLQRNTNAPLPAASGPLQNEMTDVPGNRNFYSNQNIGVVPNHRGMTNVNKMNIMKSGIRKDDCGTPIYNHNVDRNISQSISGLRNEWNMGPDNFRMNPVDSDSGVVQNSGFMPQSMPSNPMINNNPTFKQMMQVQMAMNNRLSADNNQNILEKQIMAEITQLQSKEHDLIQKINSLRPIAGSQAIIQEMTRTLAEVRQQLSTQQTTLRVIRSQSTMVNNQMPNGLINNRSVNVNQIMSMVPRTLPPFAVSQQQSGIMSELSAQMSDMKMQKNRMDLCSQTNLPSPNTISPYIGFDKSGVFYNPNNTGSGPLPQSFNNFSRASHNNFVPTHRQSGQMWPSRMMTNHAPVVHSSQSTIFSSNTDSHSLSTGPNEDVDNNSSKLQNNSLTTCESITSSNGPAGTITTALSLSQTLSSGTNVSSAFNCTRDIVSLSANISEFVPGQPWPGINYSQQDDPNVTLGTGPRSLLSITNDHLEKLANSSSLHPSDGSHNRPTNRLPGNVNGVNNPGVNRPNMTFVLIRDLPNHINIEMLKNVINPQSFPGLLQLHPNLVSKWVLLHFNTNEEALKAFKNLFGKVGIVELVPDQEISQRQQLSNSVAGPVIPCSGLVDFHQLQQQSHYLH